ncbi:hypothetical protein EV196_1033 [Mariniflexile fucanivorans]|uniref:PAS domain-containing protein n=1 Tax=Mariniflexile fucanivorans TaxID=264023 RepID=A0A4R1RKQ0_9FLAO|nr:hypothetical protein [Mariniflexile fucanivorans]TCL66599.1 hypothetical protein EV196_1033 [Mariniflexile fucanivorans]
MSTYSLEKVFSVSSTSDYLKNQVNEINYKKYLNKYIKISNPDFVAVFTTKSLDPILFQQNFGLQFDKNKSGTLQDLIDSHDSRDFNQSVKVLDLDKEMIQFVYDNPSLIVPKKNLYVIKHNAELLPNKPISLRRDIIVLSKDENGYPHIILGAWFDVTELHGTKLELLASVKDFSKNKFKNSKIRLGLVKHLK